ncbi:MAG: hypothetical protein U0869_23200 [Chloroflexota bacterium]
MPPVRLASAVRRVMDHCILALARDPGLPDGRPDAYLSLYWIALTTECGPAPLAGHLAYLWTADDGAGAPLARVLTDSVALAAGLADRTSATRWTLPGAWPAAELATFTRVAASPLGHVWRMEAASGLVVEARWEEIGEPVFASGPTHDGSAAISTALVSAARGSIIVDGRAVGGAPFPDPIWTPWFGSEQTSCVMGLGEVVFEPVAAASAGQ